MKNYQIVLVVVFSAFKTRISSDSNNFYYPNNAYISIVVFLLIRITEY